MEKEMEIDIDVTGSIIGVLPPKAVEGGNRVPSYKEGLVKLGFLLKDTLTVFGDEGEILMSQCSYGEKTIYMYSSQVDDLDYVKQVAYRTLHGNMHMDPQAAEMAKSEVVGTIRGLVQQARDTNPSLWTVLLEIHVECSIEKAGGGPGAPRGEHDYARLTQCLDNEVCGICHNGFSLLGDIIITTCHHTYDRSCFLQWMNRGSYSCPICRSDMAPMVAGQPNWV